MNTSNVITKNTKRMLPVVVAVALLTGCTTTDPYTGQSKASKTAVGAGVGVGVGAILGSLIGGRDGALIGAAAGGLTGGVIGSSMDRQDAELRQRLVGTGVQIVKQGDYIQLSMASDVTFRTDSADINTSFYDVLDSVAVVLNKYNRTNIVVSGYTDSTGTAAHNQELSERRAQSVAGYLVSRGINPNRVFAEGWGQRHPAASNATAKGRAQNRRVVITLRSMG